MGNLAAAAALASHIAHGPETPSERGHGPRTQDTHVTKAQQERRGRRAASLLVPPSARAHLTVPVVTFPHAAGLGRQRCHGHTRVESFLGCGT